MATSKARELCAWARKSWWKSQNCYFVQGNYTRIVEKAIRISAEFLKSNATDNKNLVTDVFLHRKGLRGPCKNVLIKLDITVNDGMIILYGWANIVVYS